MSRRPVSERSVHGTAAQKDDLTNASYSAPASPARSAAPSRIQCLHLWIVPRLLLLHHIQALTFRIIHILLSLRRYLRLLKLSAILTHFSLQNAIDIYFPFPSCNIDSAIPRYWITYVHIQVFSLAQLTKPVSSTEARIATTRLPPIPFAPPLHTSHPPLSQSRQSLP
jgi:hypothetical protein